MGLDMFLMEAITAKYVDIMTIEALGKLIDVDSTRILGVDDTTSSVVVQINDSFIVMMPISDYDVMYEDSLK